MSRPLILLSFAFAFLSGFMFGVYYAVSAPFPSVTVKAAAVTSSGEGAVVDITAQLIPGKGEVLISSFPYTGLDLQSSADTAVAVAQKLAGPLLFRNVVFYIHAPSEVVEGSSASVAMTVAVYALLKGKTPRQDVVVTGEIMPDGSIGPVSGLLEKLNACAEAGINVFLIPKGERYVSVPEEVVRKKSYGGVTIVSRTVNWKKVDLYEVGKEKGVQVVEVENIEEVLPYFFS